MENLRTGRKTLRESMNRKEAMDPEEILLNGHAMGGTPKKKGGRMCKDEGGMTAKRGGSLSSHRMKTQSFADREDESYAKGRPFGKHTMPKYLGHDIYEGPSPKAAKKMKKPSMSEMDRHHASFGDFMSGVKGVASTVLPFLSFLNEGGEVTIKKAKSGKYIAKRQKHAAGAVAKIRKGEY